MDLGWNREGLVDLCEKHRQTVLSLRGQECQLKDGQTKTNERLGVSQKAGYSVVIISGKNINPNKLASQLEQAKKLKPEVNVFVLSAAVHPNAYGITQNSLIKQLDTEQLEATCESILEVI